MLAIAWELPPPANRGHCAQPTPEQEAELKQFLATHKFMTGISTVATIGRAVGAMVGITDPPVASPSAELVAQVYQRLGILPKNVEMDGVAVAVRVLFAPSNEKTDRACHSLLHTFCGCCAAAGLRHPKQCTTPDPSATAAQVQEGDLGAHVLVWADSLSMNQGEASACRGRRDMLKQALVCQIDTRARC